MSTTDGNAPRYKIEYKFTVTLSGGGVELTARRVRAGDDSCVLVRSHHTFDEWFARFYNGYVWVTPSVESDHQERLDRPAWASQAADYLNENPLPEAP